MENIVIGLISDTHGLLRPEAIKKIQNVDLIFHAGDIGGRDILQRLQDIAPVHAVRGNNDHATWCSKLPVTKIVRAGDHAIFMIHNLRELHTDLQRNGVDIVVSGHSHRPLIDRRDGILYVNPGSAGPRRFDLPVCVARLSLRGRRASARLIRLG